MLQTNVSWEHNFIPTSQVRYFAYLVKTKKNKTKQNREKQNREKQNKTKNIYVPNLDRYERKMLFVTFYELSMKPWIKKD